MRTGGGHGSATVTIESFMASACAPRSGDRQGALGSCAAVDTGDELVDACVDGVAVRSSGC